MSYALLPVFQRQNSKQVTAQQPLNKTALSLRVKRKSDRTWRGGGIPPRFEVIHLSEQNRFERSIWDRIRRKDYVSKGEKQVGGITVEMVELNPIEGAGEEVDFESTLKHARKGR